MGHPGKVGGQPSWFDKLAETISNFTSRLPFFIMCLILTGLWVWAEASHHQQLAHIIIGLVAILTLIKVGILSNSERRIELAVNEKLDQILEAQAKNQEKQEEPREASKLREHQELHEKL